MEIKNSEKEYKSSHSIVYSCQYHVIFCPKFRRKVLVDGIDIRLKELILEKQKEYGYEVLEMEIMSEYVHLLLDVNPQLGMHKHNRQNKRVHGTCAKERVSSAKKSSPLLVDKK